MQEFINQQLASEWRGLMDEVRVVSHNKFKVYVATHEVDFPQCPYVIDIEDTGFFYEKKEDRDLDFSLILQIFAKKRIRYTNKK